MPRSRRNAKGFYVAKMHQKKDLQKSGLDTFEDFARRCLRQAATAKEWAFFLGKTPGYVRLLASGKRRVTEDLIMAIGNYMRVIEERDRKLGEWVEQMLMQSAPHVYRRN